jgi:hypothetical protein
MHGLRLSGLEYHVPAVRCERNHRPHLPDLKVLAGPVQAGAQHADGRGLRTQGACGTGWPRAAGGGTRASGLARRGYRRLALRQAHGVVAIGLVQLPVSGQIHAGWRRQRELIARAGRKNRESQEQRNSHGCRVYLGGTPGLREILNRWRCAPCGRHANRSARRPKRGPHRAENTPAKSRFCASSACRRRSCSRQNPHG